ncbi:MAG TPA: ABC transporter permease [Tepidisphaeraceae bacterium]|nr:ABC transporter permease [Tepidisphaeraceae bacterium]
MNLFQLVLKQMRQRALSTWLTLLSIVLGVSLAVAIMILYREGSDLFVQKNFGYEVIVGPPKGSPLQLVLNTVYQIEAPTGNIPYKVYEDLLRNRGDVKLAVPYASGDTYKGLRIVGTAPKLFNFDDAGQPVDPERRFEYQVGKSYELAEGKVFAPNRFEAVIGSDVPQRAGLTLGQQFQATHGLTPTGDPDEHETKWTVVGRLKKTHTAADRVIFIPLLSFYAISEHGQALEDQARLKAGLPPAGRAAKPQAAAPAASQTASAPAPAAPPPAPAMPAMPSFSSSSLIPVPKLPTTDPHHGHDHAGEQAHDHDHPPVAAGAPAPAGVPAAPAHDDHHGHGHEHFTLNPDGTFELDVPKSDWVVSAILVKSRGTIGLMRIMHHYKVVDPNAVAVSPAEVMRQFFDTFLKTGTLLLLLISVLVIIVASVGVLVSIYNSVSARVREIAILRALGATRARILAIICLEAGLIGLAGGLLGVIFGHLLAAGGSLYMSRFLGQSLRWFSFDRFELLTLLGVTVIAVLAGLVPALKAYRVPVATNLVAG